MKRQFNKMGLLVHAINTPFSFVITMIAPRLFCIYTLINFCFTNLLLCDDFYETILDSRDLRHPNGKGEGGIHTVNQWRYHHRHYMAAHIVDHTSCHWTKDRSLGLCSKTATFKTTWSCMWTVHLNWW